MFARLVKSTNFLVNHNPSSGLKRTNTSAKPSPAGRGSLGWLMSRLAKPVKATKKPMPNPSKGMSTHHTPAMLFSGDLMLLFQLKVLRVSVLDLELVKLKW